MPFRFFLGHPVLFNLTKKIELNYFCYTLLQVHYGDIHLNQGYDLCIETGLKTNLNELID